MPHLNELAATFADDPVVFLCVSSETRADIEASLAEHPMDAWVASDPDRSATEALGVRGIPRSFVIDTAGEIVWQGHPKELESAEIAALLP